MSEKEKNITALRIRQLREEREMSLQKFADFLGVKKTTLYDWENGNVESMKSSSIQLISNRCNVSPLWIIGYDVPKEKESQEHEGLRKMISDHLLTLTYNQLEDIEKFIETFIIK